MTGTVFSGDNPPFDFYPHETRIPSGYGQTRQNMLLRYSQNNTIQQARMMPMMARRMALLEAELFDPALLEAALFGMGMDRCRTDPIRLAISINAVVGIRRRD